MPTSDTIGKKPGISCFLTDFSVTDVCLEAGFSSLGTFSYVFTRRVGMAPTVYRQSSVR